MLISSVAFREGYWCTNYYPRFVYLSNFHSSVAVESSKAKQSSRMPPKKRNASESEGAGPLMGRFGTSLKCGIVGLPNVG